MKGAGDTSAPLPKEVLKYTGKWFKNIQSSEGSFERSQLENVLGNCEIISGGVN